MRVGAWTAFLFVASASGLAAALQTPFLSSQLPSKFRADDVDRSVRIEIGNDAGGASASTLDADAPSGSIRDRIVKANRETGTHAILTHVDFPQTSVRIKRIHAARNASSTDGVLGTTSAGHTPLDDPDAFCDIGVTSWSGYIDTIDGKSLFFYFFESRSQPLDDPVLLWTNGTSCLLTALVPLRPCSKCNPPLVAGLTADQGTNDLMSYPFSVKL